MVVARWAGTDLASLDPTVVVGDLDDVDALVLDGVSGDDDLAWCRRAPCVVVGVTPLGAVPPSDVDVAFAAGDRASLEAVLAGIEASPRASLVLVHVLRMMDDVSLDDGLVLESLAYSSLLGAAEFRVWLDGQPHRPPRTFAGPAVESTRDGDTLHVVLARPENRNAFSAELRDALVAALLPAEVDPTIVRVEVRAEGPSFSSGGDLTEFGTGIDLARAHQVRTLRSPGLALARLGERAVAHVHGTCVGAGVELPAFAHRVVAAADATFRLPEVAMGLIPGAGGTVSISRRIGRQRTAELALSGRAMGVDEAVAVGLVDEQVGLTPPLVPGRVRVPDSGPNSPGPVI